MLCNGEQKMCFLTKGVCDGVIDCPAGEDEQNCPGACDMDDPDCAGTFLETFNHLRELLK